MSLLYKIERKDSSVLQGYLFGTIHLYHHSFSPWIELAKTKLTECQIFCPELDISLLSEQSHNFEDKTDKTSKHSIKIKPGTGRFFKKHFDLEIDNLLHAPIPIIYGQLLSLLLSPILLPGSVDLFLNDLAVKSDKSILPLETFDMQSALMTNLSQHNLPKQISYIIQSPLAFRRRMMKIIDWYSQGKLTLMYKKSKADMGNMKNAMIYRRNANMAGEINLHLRQNQKVFVAVGAGHLPGAYGLIAKLKQLGYKLTPCVIS